MTQLATKSFKQSEFIRNQWHAIPEHNTPAEALLAPAYWAHVSAQMKRGDIVCALAPDDSYYLELLVLNAGKLFAKVILLRKVDISQAEALSVTIPDGFEIKFRGPRKWSVLRGKDVLKEDMDKSEAEQWISDHIKLGTIKAA